MSFKLLSYQTGRDARAGVLVGETVFDAAKLTANAAHSSVLGMLADWPKASRALAQASKSITAGKSRAKGTPLARVKLLAPGLYPGPIVGGGANSRDHAEEMARVSGMPLEKDQRELGLSPWHFMKTARGSVVGPGAEVKLPAYSKMVDWEVELAAVIGRPARNVPVERALDYVAGYTIAND